MEPLLSGFFARAKFFHLLGCLKGFPALLLVAGIQAEPADRKRCSQSVFLLAKSFPLRKGKT